MRDGHAEFRRVLLAGLLGIIGAIEVISSDGALGAGHVAADDEVGGPEVLADDHVLDGLARARHLHGVRQVRPGDVILRHLLGEGLVRLDTGLAVDVARLRRAAGRVDQHARERQGGVVQRGPHELVVGTVDRVAALEGHDGRHMPGVGDLHAELLAHLTRSLGDPVARRRLKARHGAAEILLAGRQRLEDAGVLSGSCPEDVLRLLDLVGLPHVTDVQHGHRLAVVAQKDVLAHDDIITVRVQHDRHAPELLLGQAHLLDNRVVGGARHEALQRRERARHEQLHVAGLALRQLQRLALSAGDEALALNGVIHDAAGQALAAMRRAGLSHASVDATLRVVVAHETAGTLALVRVDRNGRVDVAKRLVDKGVASLGQVAADLRLSRLPERLAQLGLLPRQVVAVTLRCRDKGLRPEDVLVGAVVRHAVLVDVRQHGVPRPVRDRVARASIGLPRGEVHAGLTLVHAAAGDEDVLLQLAQGALERLDLAVQVEVGVRQILAVAVLLLKASAVGHAQRVEHNGLLVVASLHLRRDLVRLGEQVHRVHGRQVHALEHLREVLAQHGDDDVVGDEPGGGEDHTLAVSRQVLLHGALEVVFQRREVHRGGEGARAGAPGGAASFESSGKRHEAAGTHGRGGQLGRTYGTAASRGTQRALEAQHLGLADARRRAGGTPRAGEHPACSACGRSFAVGGRREAGFGPLCEFS
mmetsp:Transcript_36694/g.87831  ORF Transcript_36694/g.87831 Transcript_36694/m.87831 type:complete len:703 (+) Transcript_36694:325-2433(+)